MEKENDGITHQSIVSDDQDPSFQDRISNSPGTGLFAGREHIGYVGIMKSDDLILVDPEILGGTPVFKNSRVPIKTLFDYLEQNYTLEEFLACFPSVTREMACRVLERSETALLSKS